MREMVLNHASLISPDRRKAVDWLKDVTTGMTQLITNRIVESTLRMSRPHHQISCMPSWSLWDALQELQRTGAREEYLLFNRLTSKIPLLDALDQDIEDRFRECESKTLASPDGDPLILCAIVDGISVGFPSDLIWENDKVTVTFDEILPNESIEIASETIDNLTRSTHAKPICERHRERHRGEFRNGVELWNALDEAFPNLLFGLDLENHLARLDPGVLSTVVNKLASLDNSAAEWRRTGGPAPQWHSKVTDESNSVKNDDKLRQLRIFRSRDGTLQLFTWHARFGNSGRIHLRFEPISHEIEIGYIGKHLQI